jgi:uncharacterized protein YerC
LSAAALYAQQHPEVSIKDICNALGRASKGPLAGVKRAGKAMAPATDWKKRTEKVRNFYAATMIDREIVQSLVAKNLSYKVIAEQLGCCIKSISHIAQSMGVRRDLMSRTDDELRAHLAEHPDTDLTTMAEAVGYKGTGALQKRLLTLGVRLKASKDGRRGAKKSIDRDKVRALLDQGTTYRMTAEKVGCSVGSVMRIASTELSITRINTVSQDQLRAYLDEHPDANLRTMSKAVGYNNLESLRARLFAMGIKLGKTPDGPFHIERKKLRSLLATRLSYPAIADRMGCSLTSVCRIAYREFGIWRQTNPHSKNVVTA